MSSGAFPVAEPFEEPDDETLRRMSAPDNEIPVAVPLNRVLARTDEVTIALLGLRVYSTGASLDLAVRSRSGPPGRDLMEVMFVPASPGAEYFLLGVELADGRRASNVPGAGSGRDLVFRLVSGGPGGRAVDQEWWLSPLPPEGPLTFVVRCGALGIDETSTVVDASIIRRAAVDVVPLWPWTRPEYPPPLPPPDIPEGSWFAGR